MYLTIDAVPFSSLHADEACFASLFDTFLPPPISAISTGEPAHELSRRGKCETSFDFRRELTIRSGDLNW